MELFKTQNLKFLDILSYGEIQIYEGEFTFITGPSGCGKSTLLRLLNATALPSNGQIFYRGRDINTCDALSHRKQVMLALQDFFLFDTSIKENFLRYFEVRQEDCPTQEYISAMLSACCAPFALDTPCHTLSGGERQRVFLAICLSFAPEVLLLDEPTSALDHPTAIQLLSSLSEHCKRQGITPIAVCHSPELVNRFSQRTIELTKGVQA